MPESIDEKSTIEIRWPRRNSELELWSDLCLARALLASSSRTLSRTSLDDVEQRFQFEVRRKARAAAGQGCSSATSSRRQPVLQVTAAEDADQDLCLVRMRHGHGGFTRDFRRFVREIEADRMSTLAALKQRPFLDAVTRLGAKLELSSAETELLCFLALVRSDPATKALVGRGHSECTMSIVGQLASVMRMSASTVAATLGSTSVLRRLRLIKSQRDFSVDDLDTTPLGALLDALIDRDGSGRDPLAHFLVASSPSTLQRTDFDHLPVGIDLVVSTLREAQKDSRRGANILLHGAPGNGKTQLGRVVAQLLEASAFEVPLVNSEGDARNGDSRVESLLLCQQALARHERPLMIFDEAEDLFPSPTFAWFFQSKEGLHKGWINRMLEENPVPTIWIANQVSHIDPAFLRRFDLVIEVPPPPRNVRQRLVDGAIAPAVISERWRRELIELDDLSPPEIERVARASTHLTGVDAAQHEGVLRQVFDQARRASGRKSAPAIAPLPGQYRPEFINADIDLIALADCMVTVKSGRLCLYGPPGSGKSAYAQYLAEYLGMPLLLRRASDLVDMYVGETEKNLARAFAHASEEGAVLLIDEADSFLQDRQRAHQSWEVSHVNELLTQMERFEGVLVMCTNLFDQLDPAALRRFDVKVKLDYLRADQRFALLDECIERHAINASPEQRESARDRLARLDRLTPGDFQTVLRRRRLAGAGDVLGFADTLAAEQAGKRGVEARAIGLQQSH